MQLPRIRINVIMSLIEGIKYLKLATIKLAGAGCCRASQKPAHFHVNRNITLFSTVHILQFPFWTALFLNYFAEKELGYLDFSPAKPVLDGYFLVKAEHRANQEMLKQQQSFSCTPTEQSLCCVLSHSSTFLSTCRWWRWDLMRMPFWHGLLSGILSTFLWMT